MSTDHTPTTTEVRRFYRSPIDAALDDEEFDRWLATVKAETWDEGYGTGVIDQTRWQDTGIPDGGVRNPYGEHRDGSTAG